MTDQFPSALCCSDKVQLESLNCVSLPPYRPKLFYLPGEAITVQRIVGYREIFKKHERIDYLRQIERDKQKGSGIVNKTIYFKNWSGNPNLCEAAPGGARSDDSKHHKSHKRKSSKSRKNSRRDSVASSHRDPGRKSSRRDSVTSGHHDPGRRSSRRDSGASQHHDHKRRSSRHNSVGSPHHDHGHHRSIAAHTTGHHDLRHREKKVGEADTNLPVQSVKPEAETIPAPVKRNVILGTGKLIRKKMTKKQKEMELHRHEKDCEWLELSDSNDDEDDEHKRKEITTFNKPIMEWMDENLSHETQMLHHHLKWFTLSAKLLGRMFWYTVPNPETNLIDFLLSKRKMLVFLLTTFLLWIIVCFIVLSLIDIRFSSKKYDGIRSSFKKQDDSHKRYVDYEAIEALEFEKHKTLMYAIVIQAVTVGLWSVLVVLRDGLLISNYLNCWNAALTEMETSGVSQIQMVTLINGIYFAVYASITMICFAEDSPRAVRTSSGFVAMLVFRCIFPQIRTRPYHSYFGFQVLGLFIHLYIVYCTRNLFTLIHIMALLLKNSAEMWNLKFGLYFSQFIFEGNGQLLHIRLSHSLSKLFTHHRLICGLVDHFGVVFTWPISISLFLQMSLFTKCIVDLLKLKIYTEDDFGGHKCVETLVSFSTPRAKPETLCIRLFHSQAEQYVVEILVTINVLIDFFFNAEIISAAGRSFLDGYEFVRRTGTTLCTTSHQRRLVQSLEWSMAATAKIQLSASGLFTLDRDMIFAALATAFSFFSLIVQLQDIQYDSVLYFINYGCGKKPVNTHGYCLLNITVVDKVVEEYN